MAAIVENAETLPAEAEHQTPREQDIISSESPRSSSSPKSKSSNFTLACVHEEMNPRKRSTMEDCHRLIPSLTIGDSSDDIPSPFSYFAVYDGHGGRQIVEFLEEALENNIIAEIQLDESSERESPAGIAECLTRAFLITDMQSKTLNITTSGATAVSALIHDVSISESKAACDSESRCIEGEKEKRQRNRVLYVANVGDSRAVLCCQRYGSEKAESPKEYMAKRLSYDHRAEDESEQVRIKEAGGFIVRSRVLGILAVSRSFGDHGMKDFVTAEPFVTETNLDDGSCGSCPFLILACDGVWDVLSDQQAVDLILAAYREAGQQPLQDAAQLLVRTAIEKGSADNVTAIVIFL